jgi:hypothetical protein
VDRTAGLEETARISSMKTVNHKKFRAHIDKYHDLTIVIHDEGYVVVIHYRSKSCGIVATVMYSQFTNPEYTIGE